MSTTNETAICVTNLSKLFKIYSHPADMFWELLKGRPRYKPFWALRDISFNVKKGQVVGIMGRNGAGKSTLLKILTGTLDKTGGEVIVNGRVSSILELGTGFTGAATGRENIYLGGLMVGLSHDEIIRKMDWIIEFSELADFIDQPFKTYSTGMQARLTFATAVCIDPDILIVDEALAVGDAKFQRKSFGKIQEFCWAGHTIILVSHDMNTINTICDHAILLEGGRIYGQGNPKHISEIYQKLLFAADSQEQPTLDTVSIEIENGSPMEIVLDASKFQHEQGYAWIADLSTFGITGDSSENPARSNYVLFEQSQPRYTGHAMHDHIRQYGRGFYSHWGHRLYFSTSDNSDPRTNKRQYSLRHKGLVQQGLPSSTKVCADFNVE